MGSNIDDLHDPNVCIHAIPHVDIGRMAFFEVAVVPVCSKLRIICSVSTDRTMHLNFAQVRARDLLALLLATGRHDV